MTSSLDPYNCNFKLTDPRGIEETAGLTCNFAAGDS